MSNSKTDSTVSGLGVVVEKTELTLEQIRANLERVSRQLDEKEPEKGRDGRHETYTF